jgi:nucleotide-binding universal stress UspA family protein
LRILAAVDCSSAARPVLAMATAVAPLFRAEVEAVHVVENGTHTVTFEAERAGVTLRLLRGDPPGQLAAELRHPDVVAAVVGACAHVSGAHAGHLPLALVAATDKPVVVVHPSVAPPERLRRLVLAIEGAPGRGTELQRAVGLAETAGLDVVVVHVDDWQSLPSFDDQVQHETESYAHEFLARFVPGAAQARLELRIGFAPDQILEASQEAGAELVAVGWPRLDDPERGQVARALLDRSRVPVLLLAIA